MDTGAEKERIGIAFILLDKANNCGTICEKARIKRSTGASPIERPLHGLKERFGGVARKVALEPIRGVVCTRIRVAALSAFERNG